MKRDAILLTVTITVGVLLLYVFLAFLPLARQLNDRRRALAAKEQELAAAEQLLTRYPEYRARAIRIQMQARHLETRLPPQPRIPDLLKDITQVATECNIREFQFVPQALVKRAGYWEQPVHMTLNCGYHALGQFYQRVAELPRLISARDVQLTGQDKTGRSESVSAELTLVTYVLAPQ